MSEPMAMGLAGAVIGVCLQQIFKLKDKYAVLLGGFCALGLCFICDLPNWIG